MGVGKMDDTEIDKGSNMAADVMAAAKKENADLDKGSSKAAEAISTLVNKRRVSPYSIVGRKFGFGITSNAVALFTDELSEPPHPRGIALSKCCLDASNFTIDGVSWSVLRILHGL